MESVIKNFHQSSAQLPNGFTREFDQIFSRRINSIPSQSLPQTEGCFLTYAIDITLLPKCTKRSQERRPCILFSTPRGPCDSSVPSGDSHFVSSHTALCSTEMASRSSVTCSFFLHMPRMNFDGTPSAAPSLPWWLQTVPVSEVPRPSHLSPSGWTDVQSVFGDGVGIPNAAVDLGQRQRLPPSLKDSWTELLRGLGSKRALRSGPSSNRFGEPLLLLFTRPPCLPSPWPFVP